jgi:flagellar basal-body rod protein FlgC
MSGFSLFAIAGSALTAQSARLNAVASNLANADSATSPAGCASQPEGMGPEPGEVVESTAPLRMQYDPANPAADEKGYVALPNVNVVEEMVNMISASRAYQTNAEVMNTAKALMSKTLTIGQ